MALWVCAEMVKEGERGALVTDAESEEEEEGYGVGAQAPVQVALLGLLLGSGVHWDGWVGGWRGE